jgi:hypothetical protein
VSQSPPFHLAVLNRTAKRPFLGLFSDTFSRDNNSREETNSLIARPGRFAQEAMNPMMFSHRILTMAAILLTAALTVGPARAATPEIVDKGKFFDADTIRRATRIINQIYHEFKREVVIETYETIPDAPRTKADEGPFFRKWARERARDLRVNGVYIMICRTPHWFQVEEGNQTRRIFPEEDEKELERIFMKNLAHDPNKALLEGVAEIERGIAAHSRAGIHTGRHEAPSGGYGVMGWICLGVVILGGLWLVFGLVRGFSGMGGGGGGGAGGVGGGGMGGGGGGFLSSMLGGMLGGAAGAWMYDSFFGRGGSSAYAGSDPGPTTGGVGPDTDYSGGGGDYDAGNDTGGSDPVGGGDDGGGGDWGGGDGGGGGEW